MGNQISKFPETITFKSDKNVLVLDSVILIDKKNKTEAGIYTYTKSITKKGLQVTLKLDFINSLNENKMIVCS